jgi:hypothetical protein
MKKIERLEWVAEHCGPQFVLPYQVCYSWEQIKAAIEYHEARGIPWSMRSDYRYGKTQGFQLPHTYEGDRAEVRGYWNKYRDQLLYFFYEAVLSVYCNGAALLLDPENILIEYNDKDTTVSQRQMYKNGGNISVVALGSNNLIYRTGPRDKTEDRPLRCYKPDSNFAIDNRFDVIYNLMTQRRIDEMVFSVRKPGKKVIVW